MQSFYIRFPLSSPLISSLPIIKTWYRLPRVLPQTKIFIRLFFSLSWSPCLYLYQNMNKKIRCDNTEQLVNQFNIRRQQMKQQQLIASKKSILSIVWSIISHTFRLFHLFFIFFPVIILFPFRNIGFIRNFWLNLLVWAVEKAGVVWIKTFQYLSHRRDIIGPDMADKFVHLRQHSPQHSFQDTEKAFLQSFGQKISDIFSEFDKKPIASGSVSQVYKAIYKDKKVAVKVRHPGVQKNIQRDINLIFFISRALSFFSRRFYLPTSDISMKLTLMDQIDFTNQKTNLIIFNKMFKQNQSVKFPFPFQQSTQTILIETFQQGVPITHFQQNPHQLNAVIARLGAVTFFQMLMKNNYIHADCHGGNILVKIEQKSDDISSQIKEFFRYNYNKISSYLTVNSLQSQTLKKLFSQSRKQQEQIHQILKKSKDKVRVTLIDVGMVIRLDQSDRINFISFIKSVLHGNGQKCAQMIFNLSLFDGRKIQKQRFKKYLSQLHGLFSQLNNQPLDNLRGFQLLVGMLNIIRQHNMKLQGEFATLLTNMLILQAIAKQLNPNINILKCSIPYFQYVKFLNFGNNNKQQQQEKNNK